MKVDFGLAWREDDAVLPAAIVSAWLMGASGALTSVSVAGDRVLYVEHWLKAVLHHQPESVDDPVTEIASWPDDDFRTLWIDLKSLIVLMRKPGAANLVIPSVGRRVPVYLYTPAQETRLGVLACAAAGMVFTNDYCVKHKAASQLDADLHALAAAAAEGRGVGADNYILERGALLHSDIAMLTPEAATPPISNRPSRGFHVDISDGRVLNVRESAVHWEIARTLLDAVRPTRFARPAPGQDEMVRDWYRSTAAWLQYHQQYDNPHLDHARELFPNDADILFLSGTQHETYATPGMQSVVRSLELPPGYVVTWSSDRGELRQAETYFRRSLAVNNGSAAAHLRLGRVLALEGRFADAEPELREAIASTTNDMTRYYGELFLGSVEESRGNFDAAARGYQRAASLYPRAQSPLIALAALARRRGDRAGTLQAARMLFGLPPADDDENQDPWWIYNVAQALNADDLVEELRRLFTASER